jgi:ribulose-5-phosphate 4-epimerase/fuculose-1-phosphate aldolase
VWDIADKFGANTNLLVVNMDQGRDMTRMLADNSVVLMRGHGFSAAADSLLKVVRLCVYLPRNARILLNAMRLGEFTRMSEGEINSRHAYRSEEPAMQRAWEYWAKRAGCADMLGSDPGGV